MKSIPHNLDATILNELNPGENVIWSSAPKATRLAIKALPFFLFGVPEVKEVEALVKTLSGKKS